jgi:hypothetical protein
MQIQDLIGVIFFVIFVIFLIYLLIYWANLAWRQPAKLKEKAVERSTRFFGSNYYVWLVRIMTLIYGLTLLILFLSLVFSLLGVLK